MIIFSNLNPIIYFLAVLMLVPIAMIIILGKKKPFSSYKLGCLLFAGCAYWLLFYILELSSRTLKFKIIWSQLQYIVIAIVPITLFILTLYFSGYRNWLNIKKYFMLAIIPVVVLAFVFSNELHHLFWKEHALVSAGKYFLVEIKYGIIFYIFAGYMYLLLILSFVIILKTLTQKIRLFKLQSIILMSALSIATLS